MNRSLITFGFVLLMCVSVCAQMQQHFSGDSIPTGYCSNTRYTNLSTGITYSCNETSHTWQVNTGATFNMGISGGIGDMLKANNLSDLMSVAVARTNLGLGTLATQSGTVSDFALTDLSNVSGTVSVSNFPASQAVTGTFWQGTQPVSLATNTPDITDRAARLLGHVTVDSAPSTPVTGPLTDAQLRASAVPVSGTMTANQGGTWNITVNSALPTGGNTLGGVNLAQYTPVSGRLPIDGSGVTQPVSGTVTVNAGTNTSTANLDIALSTRLKPADTLAGVTTVTTVTNPVAATQSGTWTIQPGNTANTTPWLATARMAGNTGAILDAANNAAAPANVIATGLETATQGTTQPTVATAGNMRRPVESTDGAQYVRVGGPVTWSCGLDAIGATLTQCQAAPAAGLKLYITDIVAQSTTTTGGQFGLRLGTGTNCATGTSNLFPSATATARYASPANTVAPTVIHFIVPLSVTAANALCVLGAATNTTTITINGYTAP